MSKEFEKYIPEDVEIMENNKYFNNDSLKGGSKSRKEKEIDKLLSEKFLKEYFNKKKER